MEKQYIYILSNAQQPDVVKVGKTNIHPEVRAKDINKGAGVIGKWQVEWYIVVPDSEIAEKIAHYLLKDVHYGKEFFKISTLEASTKISNKLIEFFEIEKPEVWESDILKKSKELKMKMAQAKLKLLALKF